jgi:hypothetical protein
VSVGSSVRSLPRGLRSASGAIRYRTTRSGTAFVYVVKSGRVRALATVDRTIARKPALIRRSVKLLLAARGSQERRRFVPAAAQASGAKVDGQPLAGTSDPELNRKLALLCSLQLQTAQR